MKFPKNWEPTYWKMFSSRIYSTSPQRRQRIGYNTDETLTEAAKTGDCGRWWGCWTSSGGISDAVETVCCRQPVHGKSQKSDISNVVSLAVRNEHLEVVQKSLDTGEKDTKFCWKERRKRPRKECYERVSRIVLITATTTTMMIRLRCKSYQSARVRIHSQLHHWPLIG